jgi:hypothetical protein
MMTRLLAIALVTAAGLCGPAAPSAAQVQRGAISGTAHDGSGAILPGVVLTLSSDLAAPRETATGDRGEFRFTDLDPGRYTLRAALEGFAPLVRETILVGVGAGVEITIEMALATVAEEIVVTASTPMLDVRRQGTVTNFDQVMLNEVPTARDPWALLPHLPGVQIARPNVGGSESTNQAAFTARGDNGQNTMWNIDGVTITDMAATGASTTYFDFNVFEEVQFTTGGLDSRQQTGGLGINLVSKRGTNALRAGARAFFSNDVLQGENISDAQRAAGLSGNRISQLAEYGADAGGPVRDGRLWFWAGTSVTDVRQVAINGYPDEGDVTTIAARGDAELNPATRFSFFYHRGEKQKAGRGAAPDRPAETTWDQGGATHIYKAEASRVFAPALFLSGKFAYVDVGFHLTPQSGLAAQAYQDVSTGVWHGGYSYSSSDRKQYQTQVDGDWVRGRHQVKFGFQHRRTSSREAVGWPGDATYTWVNAERLGLPTGVGYAFLTRPSALATATGTLSAYAGDVFAAGRWTLDAGVRVDRQRARNEPSYAAANGLSPAILPALEYPGGPYTAWVDLSPRVAVTFRAGGRTIVRGSYAQFASQLGSNVANFNNPALSASIQYRFQDLNGDRLAQAAELVGPTGSVMNVNPADPAAPFSPNQVDPDLRSTATRALVGGVEHEVMPDFSVGVSLGRGDTTNVRWTPYIGLTGDDFEQYVPGVPANVSLTTPVYRLAPRVTLPSGNARILTNRDGYVRRYWNVDVTATKRLTNRWMLRGFVTWQQQREYFEDPARAIQDPTPRLESAVFNSGLVDGGIAVDQNAEFIMHATWLYSVAGLYELPWGVSLSGTWYGRQGNPVAEVLSVSRLDGLGTARVLLDRDFGAGRYPAPHFLDLRMQKQLAMGRSNATLTFDVFNVLNDPSTLRQFSDAVGTNFGRPLEIVAPRLVRLGLQVRF